MLHLGRVRHFALAQERESFGLFLLGHVEQAVIDHYELKISLVLVSVRAF